METEKDKPKWMTNSQDLLRVTRGEKFTYDERHPEQKVHRTEDERQLDDFVRLGIHINLQLEESKMEIKF